MSRPQRITSAVAALSVLAGGATVAVPASAAADDTVRWISLEPIPDDLRIPQRAVPGPGYPFTVVGEAGLYLMTAGFPPTPGCTYRASTALVGAGVSANGLPGIYPHADGRFYASWAWNHDPAGGDAVQAALYVVGRCDDGSYEMGNMQWYRWADGTQGEGPMPPFSPTDPADAQRVWDEGYPVPGRRLE